MRFKRSTSQRKAKPPASPIAPPPMKPMASSSSAYQPGESAGFSNSWTQTRVRNTAMGSFMPDSSSSVPPTRALTAEPLPCSSMKTAAASVEASTDPSSTPSSGERPMKRCASPAMAKAESSTPRVARLKAGQNTSRTTSRGVRRPPSNRMMASAIEPTAKVER